MRHRRARLLPFVIPLVWAGCGGGAPAGTPMSTHMGMVGNDLTMLSAAAAEHKRAVLGAKQVSDIASLESSYSVTANALCTDMSSMCVMMKDQCMNMHSEMAATQPLADVADQMKQECGNHRAAMAGAADLAAAATEENRHQAALADLQAKLQGKIDGWRTAMADYTCSATGHTH